MLTNRPTSRKQRGDRRRIRRKFGRKIANELERNRDLAGIGQRSRNVTRPDGSKYRASSRYGNLRVKIHSPPVKGRWEYYDEIIREPRHCVMIRDGVYITLWDYTLDVDPYTGQPCNGAVPKIGNPRSAGEFFEFPIKMLTDDDFYWWLYWHTDYNIEWISLILYGFIIYRASQELAYFPLPQPNYVPDNGASDWVICGVALESSESVTPETVTGGITSQCNRQADGFHFGDNADQRTTSGADNFVCVNLYDPSDPNSFWPWYFSSLHNYTDYTGIWTSSQMDRDNVYDYDASCSVNQVGYGTEECGTCHTATWDEWWDWYNCMKSKLFYGATHYTYEGSWERTDSTTITNTYRFNSPLGQADPFVATYQKTLWQSEDYASEQYLIQAHGGGLGPGCGWYTRDAFKGIGPHNNQDIGSGSWSVFYPNSNVDHHQLNWHDNWVVQLYMWQFHYRTYTYTHYGLGETPAGEWIETGDTNGTYEYRLKTYLEFADRTNPDIDFPLDVYDNNAKKIQWDFCNSVYSQTTIATTNFQEHVENFLEWAKTNVYGGRNYGLIDECVFLQYDSDVRIERKRRWVER